LTASWQPVSLQAWIPATCRKLSAWTTFVDAAWRTSYAAAPCWHSLHCGFGCRSSTACRSCSASSCDRRRPGARGWIPERPWRRMVALGKLFHGAATGASPRRHAQREIQTGRWFLTFERDPQAGAIFLPARISAFPCRRNPRRGSEPPPRAVDRTDHRAAPAHQHRAVSRPRRHCFPDKPLAGCPG